MAMAMTHLRNRRLPLGHPERTATPTIPNNHALPPVQLVQAAAAMMTTTLPPEPNPHPQGLANAWQP
jgi:hypothetical protein